MRTTIKPVFPVILWTSLAVAQFGCAETMVHRDPSPVVVSARPPDPPKVVREPAPARVEVKQDRIEVKEQIFFESGHARIAAESFSLLDEIAVVVNEHPELVKIRIEGHTDDVGGSRANLALSKRRAVSVRTYLVSKGVDPVRLIAEGYGHDNPIADNDTPEGRAKNRRVAFTVLDRNDDAVLAVRTREDR